MTTGSRPALSRFRVLSFDCYGTLIDWEKGIIEALRPLTNRIDPPPDRAQLLRDFGRIETQLEAARPDEPYSLLLEEVHAQLALEWQAESHQEERRAFGASVGEWPAFPDSRDALLSLKRRYALVILSNVDHVSFDRSAHRLGIEFDHVFTAQDIGSYKPALRNFEYLIDRLGHQGYRPDEILHTAQSLYHDHVPANAVGLATAWINRQAGRAGATPSPAAMPRIDFEFPTLEAMARCAEQFGDVGT